ncbi:multicopy suppressor of BFA (Brefeldin A) [Malassezia cuniculi]|uniref:Multicopy suppressor of BFA (Brefeldin A) n=1 Tax=Malassezia cuniculi TaxID=948313 RepID=A0AAF0ETT8_9BASI|nr:multicopy suppressor of BFA (Brefeldin A) [Malassezia cuniculi]
MADDTQPKPEVVIARLPGGKPDKEAHHREMDRIKSEIDKAQAKMTAVRAALSGEGLPSDSPAAKRRTELRSELDKLRAQQSGHKGARSKVFNEIKSLQDEIATKVKALQATKSRSAFKSPAELDAHVRELEAQVESGSLKIVEERKLLNEISALKKTRKGLDQIGAQQNGIDALRAKVEALRVSLDDPESQAVSRRYDEIKGELDQISKEQERIVGSRSKLLDQRTAISKQLDALYQERRARQAAYQNEQDRHFARMTAERERRNAQIKAEREAAEIARQEQEEEQLREEAALPAFAKEIEDCDALINYFSSESRTDDKAESASAAGTDAASSSVEASVPEGAVVVRRDEDNYFVAGGGKKKGNKKKSRAERDTNALNVPFGMLSALMSLSIPPPTNHADLPRVVDNIKLKREYFVSNQERATQENIQRAEEKIAAQRAARGADQEQPKEEST